jgi:hypothetical protein
VADLGRLIVHTPNLRTLDLDQTSLGDAGVAKLFQLLTEHQLSPIGLRSLYLNATGAGPTTAKALGSYLASPNCTITSLYVSCNPLGSTATVADLATGLAANKGLKRLVCQSIGLTGASAAQLLSAVRDHPELTVLDISHAFATEDLGARYNWLTEEFVDPACELIATAPKLLYVDLGYTQITQHRLNQILEMIERNTEHGLLYFGARAAVVSQLAAGGRVNATENLRAAQLKKAVRTRLHENVKLQYGGCLNYDEWFAGVKRFVINPRDVRYIDSVYRNRDAQLARRGLKILQKDWGEDRTLLQRVMDDDFTIRDEA